MRLWNKQGVCVITQAHADRALRTGMLFHSLVANSAPFVSCLADGAAHQVAVAGLCLLATAAVHPAATKESLPWQLPSIAEQLAMPALNTAVVMTRRSPSIAEQVASQLTPTDMASALCDTLVGSSMVPSDSAMLLIRAAAQAHGLVDGNDDIGGEDLLRHVYIRAFDHIFEESSGSTQDREEAA